MTPSINRLSESAKVLGKYIIESEFDLLEEEFASAEIESFEQFTRWVTGYMYYNALVCVCEGQHDKLMVQLEADYAELRDGGDC